MQRDHCAAENAVPVRHGDAYFGILERASGKSSQPKPEEHAGADADNSIRYCTDAAHAERSAKSRGQGGKGSQSAWGRNGALV